MSPLRGCSFAINVVHALAGMATVCRRSAAGIPTLMIASLETVARKTRQLQAAGKKVVFTNGCFDILHPGHIDLLKRARTLGDVLVVAINTDASVRRFKGASRPI